MIKCCIFDLDGTLLDTLSTITYYMQITLAEHGLRGTNEEEMRSAVGNGAYNLVRRTLEKRGITDPAIVSSFHKKYSDAYDEAPYYLTKPYEGIPELLSQLSEEGIVLAVLSNKPDFATRSVIKSFFGDLFDVVHGGRDGIPLKPAPDGVYGILDELSLTVADCAYIGDSEVDVRTGIAAGIPANVAVTWGFRTEQELRAAGAVSLAHTVAELKAFIASRT